MKKRCLSLILVFLTTGAALAGTVDSPDQTQTGDTTALHAIRQFDQSHENFATALDAIYGNNTSYGGAVLHARRHNDEGSQAAFGKDRQPFGKHCPLRVS